jgi:hypothetical protein
MKRNTVKNPVGIVKWGRKSQISFAQHAWHDTTRYLVPVIGPIDIMKISSALHNRLSAPSLGKFGGGTSVSVFTSKTAGHVEVELSYSIGD